MATNSLIKQVFGNHDMIRRYLNYLHDPSGLPPFQPILYRSIAHGKNDEDIILANERSKHQSINSRVKRELLSDFYVYNQLRLRQLNTE